jgi:hypothetical protein
MKTIHPLDVMELAAKNDLTILTKRKLSWWERLRERFRSARGADLVEIDGVMYRQDPNASRMDL